MLLRCALALAVAATSSVRPVRAADPLTVSDAQALAAGKQLWQNECGGTVRGLTSWNAGENFASLGIGHYIWYPRGERGPFEESFPELVRFLATTKVALPAWLNAGEGCPWPSRAAFLRDADSPRLTALRDFLARTVPMQARFSAQRLEAALPKMLTAAPTGMADRVQRNFYAVAASPHGIYALLDYVNFKGEGVLATERYNGHGWGLLQVLTDMPEDRATGSGRGAAEDFAAAAGRVLARRVTQAPAERHEERWLAGWQSRVKTYAR